MTLAPRLSMSAAKRALTRAGLAGGLALAAGACATVPHSVETTPAALALGRPDVTPTHRQEEACATWLFGLIPLGGDAGLASLEDRLNPPEGTALARLTVDRSTAFYLIASQTCTQARATFVERRFVPGLEGEPTSARQAPAGPPRPRPTDGPLPDEVVVAEDAPTAAVAELAALVDQPVEVHLRVGGSFRGVITQANASFVVVKPDTGPTRTLRLSDIAKVVRVAP